MQPLLRLVHLSDLHCAPKIEDLDVGIRKYLPPALMELCTRLKIMDVMKVIKFFMKGLAGHDKPKAWIELERSIPLALKNDDDFEDRTHIVVTGDLSTWGDDDSLRGARNFVTKIARESGLPDPFFIYGNHDVWPGEAGKRAGFPLFAQKNLGTHRTAFRDTHFRDGWPREFRRLDIPPSGQSVVISSLNTIRHERLHNSIAQGIVRADRYWELRTGNQLAELRARHKEGDIGILLTHHPIHEPKSAGLLFNVALSALRPVHLQFHELANAGAVAGALSRPETDPKTNLIHVVLSGHTHELFPDVGDSEVTRPHRPLEQTQLQLTVGTASQERFRKSQASGSAPDDEDPPDVPPGKGHMWQLLRFYREEGDPPLLIIERIVFERSKHQGPFRPRLAGRNPDTVSDFFELPLH